MTITIKSADNIKYDITGSNGLKVECSSYTDAIQKSATLDCIHFINLRVSSFDGSFGHSMSIAKYNPLKGFEVIRDVKFQYYRGDV